MQYPHPPHSHKPLPIHTPSSLNHSPNHDSPTLPSLFFFLPSPHALLVLFPVSPLRRRQTRHPFSAKLRSQFARRAGKLCPFQLHHWPNPGFHGFHRTHPLPDLMRIWLGFQIPSQTRQPGSGYGWRGCPGTAPD